MFIVTQNDNSDARLAQLEQQVAQLEALLRNVTPVTRNADRNVTRNAERQRRYRERLKNKNSA
jgi:uncharacterized coiled-coil protein SlyX